jgi:hypothetical protein
MIAIPASLPRRFGRLSFAFFAVLSSALLVAAQAAHAGLIFTEVGLDGFVRSGNGSGPVAGVETHFTSVDFPPPTTNNSLPATNPPLPSPLLPSNNLRMAYDFVANAPLNGGTSKRAMLWITSPTGSLFANNLDDFLPTPVQFDTRIYLQELLPNQQLDIKAIRVEIFGVPNTAIPANTVISPNVGSAADPIHIHLGLTQDQLLNGTLKAFIYYDTTATVIPEPATLAMLGWMAVVCLTICRRIR